MKIVLTAILLFLCRTFTGSDRDFFYINLGLSPKRLTVQAICLDIVLFAVGLTLITMIKNAL